ncbi:MAG: DUF1045 domain-containing protein [Ahrensia sp.]
MRYAIFFTPPRGAQLLGLAHGWIGRDAFTGEATPVQPIAQLSPVEIIDFSSFPRLYGFHATLKAPFRLREGQSVDALRTAVDQWVRITPPAAIDVLQLKRLGAHFALMPQAPCADVNALAASCVRHFEPFRAALTDAEIERRRPAQLTDQQRAYLLDYGYPYVFDAFRFHMTLTRAVSEEEADTIGAALQHHFAPLLGKPLAIDGVGLFCQPENGANFTIEHYAPLGGGGESQDNV